MMEAEALCRLDGAQDKCLSVLQKVDEIFDEDTPEQYTQLLHGDDKKWTGFTHAVMMGYKGSCYLHLQRPGDARSLLLSAVQELPAGFSQRYSRTLADLATTYVQSQDIEEACKIATEALISAAHAKSPRALRRLQSFQETLRPWQSLTCVKRFNSAIRAVNDRDCRAAQAK